MNTPLHPQVRIRHAGRSAEVDAKLAPLILELWRAGINTALSCQSWSGFIDSTTGVIPVARGGSIYLVFPGGEGDVARFKHITRRLPRFRSWRCLFSTLGVELWFRPERLRSLVACLRRYNHRPSGSDDKET